MEENKIIDQSELAQTVGDQIKYSFFDYFLVKPLDPIKVTKEFSKPVSAAPTKDENGIEAQDFDKVETEVKEVDSDYRKAVVIKVPLSYQRQIEDKDQRAYVSEIKAGDIVILKDTAAGPRSMPARYFLSSCSIVIPPSASLKEVSDTHPQNRPF